MRTPRLVASDIDGTLLDPMEQVTPVTAAAVACVLAAGVPFVLATGRPPRWVLEPAKAAGVSGYAVCSNGAVVYDIGDDKVLRVRGLDPMLLHDVAGALAGVLPDARFAAERVGESAFALNGGEFVAERDYLHPWPGDAAEIAPRAEVLGHEAVKLLVRCAGLDSVAITEAAGAVLGDEVNVTFSTNTGLVEIAAAGVSKATGLADVADWLGLAAADVVAFGDMPNDVEMLRWAGLGVAMSSGHPDAQAAADELAPPNAEDGVAAVLARWFPPADRA